VVWADSNQQQPLSNLPKKERIITTINQVLTFTSAASVEQVEDPIVQVSEAENLKVIA
jgi:hypothetical protein